MTFCPSWERQSYTKKYDNLKLVNLVQTNEILLIENSTYLNIRFEIFGWICMYVYIDRIWHWMTYKGWYAIKPNQPTNQPTMGVHPIKIKQTRPAGHCRRNKTNSNVTFSCRLLTRKTSMLANQQKLTFISSMQTLGAIYKTYQEWWPIGADGERESRESMLKCKHHMCFLLVI